MLDILADCIAVDRQIKDLGLGSARKELEEKIRILMNDISVAPWEKLDPLVAYGRTLLPAIVPMLLVLYAATTRLRIPMNRAQRRKGGISVCDDIDTVHHFFWFALETYRGYPHWLLKCISTLWDDVAARVVRGKPDHEDLLANRLGVQWGNLLLQDPLTPPSAVICPVEPRRAGRDMKGYEG